MDRTLRRDPKNRDHKMTRDEVVALAPNFYLNRYFTAVGAPDFHRAQRLQSRLLQAGERRDRARAARRTEDLRELASARLRRALALQAVRRRQLQNAAGSLTGTDGDPGPLEALRGSPPIARSARRWARSMSN